jgi:hypothetical protein
MALKSYALAHAPLFLPFAQLGFLLYTLYLCASPAPKFLISKPAAQKAQQQQALTQAPSTKQSKSKLVAAQRQAAWLGWLLTCFWCFYLAGRRQNF